MAGGEPPLTVMLGDRIHDFVLPEVCAARDVSRTYESAVCDDRARKYGLLSVLAGRM